MHKALILENVRLDPILSTAHQNIIIHLSDRVFNKKKQLLSKNKKRLLINKYLISIIEQQYILIKLFENAMKNTV